MLKRVAFGLLILTIVWAPLPFASNRDWSLSFLSLLILLSTFIYCLDLIVTRADFAIPLKLFSLMAVLFTLPLLWGIAQTLHIMPADFHHQIWNIWPEEMIATRSSSAISINPSQAWLGLIKLVSHGIVFWLTAQFCRVESNARTLSFVIVLSCLFYAGYGLIIHLNGLEMILWYQKWAYIGDVTSTFINRNSFATFAGFGLIVAIALLVNEYSMLVMERLSFRQSLTLFLDRISPKVICLILAIIVLSISLVLSNSRAGMFSSLVGLIVLFYLIRKIGSLSSNRSLVFIFLGIIGGIFMFSIFGETLLKRFDGETGAQVRDRLLLYEVVWKVVMDHPVTGTGLGTYLDMLWAYKPDELRGLWDKAHNSYLEMALELGIPATLSFLGSILLVTYQCFIGISLRRRDHIYSALTVAIVSIIAVHSLVDFSAQIPAVGHYLAVIMGIGFAQSTTSRT